MNFETPPLSPLAEAIARGRLGVATLDEALFVQRRDGPLSEWLPREGAPACASPILLNMEESLRALKESDDEIVLPSVRAGPEGARIAISIAWNAATRVFVIITTPDHASGQIERLLAPERREKQILQQQAEASAARLRVADALYRDIVESSGYFVLRFGLDMKVVYANRVAARFLGLPQDAAIGRAIFELFPPQPGAKDPWTLVAAVDQPASFELPARDARGALRWLGWSVHFLGEEGGGEFQAVARDATASRLLRSERDKAQEEARAAAIANERLRIAHDLHDTLVRSIVTMIAQTRLVARTTADEKTKETLREIETQAREGLREAREAITRLRAARRGENNLRGVVDAFAAQRRENALVVECAMDFESAELSRETEEVFARVLREALRNVELHSGATRVRIELCREAGAARLVVEDDGAGFDPRAPAPGHFGVAGMRERARLAGATLEIDSAPGAGTRITLMAPEAF